jgi:ElaB/YqjD/DUF883 family membrane-anchored ribosome-binding protein
MEVYFKNLTAEGVSVEKLVEDLMLLANDVEGLVKATSGKLGPESQAELATAFARVKSRCESLRLQAMAGMRATDRVIRTHPYYSIGAAVGIGVLCGALLFGSHRDR